VRGATEKGTPESAGPPRRGNLLRGILSGRAARRRFRRALAIFSAVFVLAAAAVVWVAVREVERERLIRENERIADLILTAEAAAERISTSFKAEFGPLEKIAAAFSPSATRGEISSLIFGQAPALAAFREIFLVEPGKDPDALTDRPPFALTSEEGARTVSPGIPQTADFRTAERLEFRAKDLPAAIAAYEKAFSGATTGSSRARILHALARTYRKSGRQEKSIETYDRVRRESGLVLSEDGSPLGILAAIETGNIYNEINRPSFALENWFSLYAEILSAKFPLSRMQFRPFISLLDDLIEPVIRISKPEAIPPNSLELWEGLKRRAMAVFDRIRVLDLIRAHFSAAPVHTTSRSETQANITFQTKMIEGTLWIAGFLPLPGSRTLGALIDERTALGKFVLPALPAAEGKEPGIEAAVIDLSGRVLGGASATLVPGVPSFQQALPDAFSAWTVRFVDRRPAGFEREFRRRRNLYFGGAALVLAALFAGGWTALRGMEKDMEVANLKSDFVATVSHELRTPLTGIRAMSELLKDDRVPDDRTRRQYYATLHRESERLGRMIENILDFSKIEAGLKEYRRAPTDPADLTRETATRFQEWTADKGFKLDIRIGEELPAADLDAEAISRALLNVLDNAAKYSGNAREIEVSLRAERATLVWEIRDHGLGISPDDLPRVFDKFFRSRRNPEAPVRGSGIGLTIVKHIIEAHGGTVLINSREGQGTIVTITIPGENKHGRDSA